ESQVFLPQAYLEQALLDNGSWPAEQKIRQRLVGDGSVERKRPVASLYIALIHLDGDHRDAKAEVVAVANPVHVVGPLPLIAMENGRSVGSSAHGKVVRHGEVDEVRINIEHIYADLDGAGHVRRDVAIDGEAGVGEAKGIDKGRGKADLIPED